MQIWKERAASFFPLAMPLSPSFPRRGAGRRVERPPLLLLFPLPFPLAPKNGRKRGGSERRRKEGELASCRPRASKKGMLVWHTGAQRKHSRLSPFHHLCGGGGRRGSVLTNQRRSHEGRGEKRRKECFVPSSPLSSRTSCFDIVS